MNPSSRPQEPDASLWSDWSQAHAPAVRGYVMAMVRRPDLVDDLVQEVFCRAWQARDRYREQGSARAYLLRIADRLLCDRGRTLGREVNVSQEGWRQIEPTHREPGPAEGLAREEALRQLGAAMESLSPAQRRVLLLRYYGELSFSEIGEIVGCPTGTALSHAHRGLLALRKLMDKIAE